MHSAVLAWLIVQFVAAIFAPVEREAAIKFALRSAGGAALFFIAADWIRSGRRAAWIMSAVAIGAVVSACAGVLEIHSDAVQAALLIFKTQATLVGGQVRASGTFQYANTAAMYWEAALPVLIAVGVWWSIGRGQRRWIAFALAASLIVIEAIVLSASRAAVVSIALTLGIMIVADRASHTRSGLARSGVISLIALGRAHRRGTDHQSHFYGAPAFRERRHLVQGAPSTAAHRTDCSRGRPHHRQRSA